MTIVCCCWQHYNVILSNFYFVISCIYRICMKSGGQALYIGVICLHIELCGIFRNFYPLTQTWIRNNWTIIRLQWVHICLCHFPSYWVFPDSSVGKESTCNAGDPGSMPGLGRFPREGIGYPLPVFFSFRGSSDSKESACNAGDLDLIPGLGRPLEEGMANHSSILAWRIPWTEEPDGLQSVGLQRVTQLSNLGIRQTQNQFWSLSPDLAKE